MRSAAYCLQTCRFDLRSVSKALSVTLKICLVHTLTTFDVSLPFHTISALQARTSFSSSTSGQGESQPDVESLEGFVPATRSQRSRIAQNTQSPSSRGDQFPQASPAAPEPQLGPRITSQEASHIVEQAATGMNGPHRLRLWSEWLAQVTIYAIQSGSRNIYLPMKRCPCVQCMHK